MRKIQTTPAGVEVDRSKAGERIELKVELLTRLFGGGAQARKLDEVCWLRATAVKASLRFWWRAIYGYRCLNPSDMWKTESEIFGSPIKTVDNKIFGGPGMVKVEVHGTRAQKDAQPNPNQGSALNVAYFPATMSATERETLGSSGASATLFVTLDPRITDESKAQLMDALRCTILFGGAGARTRRGAGAIGLVDKEQAEKIGFPKDVNGLRKYLKTLSTNSGAQEFFCFGNNPKILVGKLFETGERAQEKALEVWKKFRQLRRADGHNFGRSMWPEADVIRRAANKHSKHHAPRPQYIDQAPRALLGLPIGIKFKDSDDPNANELILANGSDRYASPIWIGVTRVWEGDQAKCISVVLATEAKLPCDVVIKNHKDYKLVTTLNEVADKNHENDPDPITVNNPTHMVEQVVKAFKNSSFDLVI